MFDKLTQSALHINRGQVTSQSLVDTVMPNRVTVDVQQDTFQVVFSPLCERLSIIFVSTDRRRVCRCAQSDVDYNKVVS